MYILSNKQTNKKRKEELLKIHDNGKERKNEFRQVFQAEYSADEFSDEQVTSYDDYYRR